MLGISLPFPSLSSPFVLLAMAGYLASFENLLEVASFWFFAVVVNYMQSVATYMSQWKRVDSIQREG